MRISPAVGYRIEGGMPMEDEVEVDAAPVVQPVVDDVFDMSDTDSKYYREMFVDKEHMTLLVPDNESPAAASVVQIDDEYKAMIRTKEGTMRVDCKIDAVPVGFWRRLFRLGPSRRDIMLQLDQNFPVNRMDLVDTERCKNPLLEFSERQVIKGFKFGVLFAQSDQTKEDEMFSNVETTPEFEEFLDFLGDRIELRDWKRFRGGLDVANGSTGTHSLFTEWNNNEIMFHVSTMLPYNPLDKQQLERKRHIGNDIVIIIFQDGDTIYRPTTVSSRQIHVVLLVKSCMIDDERHYKLAVISRDDVAPFAPLLPEEPVFKKGPEFRDFLYKKLLNAERACYQAPTLNAKLTRTRKALLDSLIEQYYGS